MTSGPAKSMLASRFFASMATALCLQNCPFFSLGATEPHAVQSEGGT